MRRFLQASFVVVALLSSGVRAPADDAQALLDKNKAFAGWTFGDPSMNGLRLTGHVGEKQLVDLRRGAIWRRTVTNTEGKFSRDFGFTGQRFWQTDESGFTVPIMSDGVKYNVAYQIAMNQGIPLLSGTLHGNATIDGTAVQIVRVEDKSAFPIDAYIDPRSGRLLRAVIDPDGGATEIDVLGYLDIHGKKIISKWRVNGGDTSEFTKAEQASIADADFHPPAPRATWTFAAPDPIPITVTKDRIVIRAAVNGVEGNFIFDSGAYAISLNADFADRAKITSITPMVSHGLNGRINTSIGRADAITVGANVLHNVYVNIGVNANSRHEAFDGLFGFDLLAAAIVDIDTAKQLMTIYDPSKYAVNTTGPQLAVDLSAGAPAVPVTLNGSVKAHLEFDTGDPMSVFVTDALYGGPHGVQMRFEGYSQMGGAGGDSQRLASCGHMESIDIGTIRYGNVPICFGPSKQLFGNDRGIIGLDFLKHFDLTFDYPEGALYLTPLKT